MAYAMVAIGGARGKRDVGGGRRGSSVDEPRSGIEGQGIVASALVTYIYIYRTTICPLIAKKVYLASHTTHY